MTDKDEIAQLKKEVDKLKASLTPTPTDPIAVGAWRDQMHALAERRASSSGFSRADLEAFEQACPTSTIRAIACRDNRAPTGPSGQAGASGQVTKVSSNPGLPGSNTSGWVNARPLGPPPGVGYVDMLCEVDAAKEREGKK